MIKMLSQIATPETTEATITTTQASTTPSPRGMSFFHTCLQGLKLIYEKKILGNYHILDPMMMYFCLS